MSFVDTVVKYVRSRDGARIAYCVTGEGPALAYLPIPSMSHVQLFPRQPGVAAFLERLGRGRRLIRMDFRGTGMSQRDCEDLSPEALADDLQAVVDDLGLEQLDVYAGGVRVSPTLRFALRRPATLRRIILAVPFTARPVSLGDPGVPGFLGLIKSNWDFFIETMAQRNSRGTVRELADLIAFMHRCSDQRNQIAEIEASRFEEDWQIATRVTAPVLVTDRLFLNFVPQAQIPAFAERFPHGRFIALPESVASPPFGDPELLLEAVEEFLGVAAASPASAALGVGSKLSPREREVLALLADGRTEREIASSLGISPATASRHVANLYAKLGVHRRAEAVAWAIRNGVSGT
jgi:DNA-binding CsgD family transcriptional regulator/pimeloyl-ACP methyl ester carboxylesterase